MESFDWIDYPLVRFMDKFNIFEQLGKKLNFDYMDLCHYFISIEHLYRWPEQFFLKETYFEKYLYIKNERKNFNNNNNNKPGSSHVQVIYTPALNIDLMIYGPGVDDYDLKYSLFEDIKQ